MDSIFPCPTQINSWALSKVGAMLVSLFQISMLFLPSNISFWVDSNSSFNHVDSLTQKFNLSPPYELNLIPKPPPPRSHLLDSLSPWVRELLHAKKYINKEVGSLELKHQLFGQSLFLSSFLFLLTLLYVHSTLESKPLPYSLDHYIIME